ncbi:MAG TPA: hypothetical protein VF201_01130 [Nitrolancea sp.]
MTLDLLVAQALGEAVEATGAAEAPHRLLFGLLDSRETRMTNRAGWRG